MWIGYFNYGTNASDIQVGVTDLAESYVIAPEFLVGSAWGAESGNVAINYYQAKKRCATYQEQGRPAGRWRLPTEAELMFCIQRQEEGLIPTTFELSEGNWASSGYYYQNKGAGAKFYPHNAASGEEVAFLRCVYDSWYWGDESVVSNHIFTPKPTKN